MWMFRRAARAMMMETSTSISMSMSMPRMSGGGGFVAGSSTPRMRCASTTGTTTMSNDDASEDQSRRRARVNRALYRAKQRGFLELDIMVGTWAETALVDADEGFLDAFEEVLDEENPELFKWLTAQETPPERTRTNPAYASLEAHCVKFLDEKASKEARAAHGREWIRGWNDSGQGNQ